MRSIFVNLPVKDLDKSKAFFTELGFVNNPDFTDDTAAAMVVDENIFLMLLTEEKFLSFINGEISDPTKTEVITCLSAASREDVDQTLAKALANGARPWKPVMDYGFMYGASFLDLDDHVWELVFMDPNAKPQ